MSIEVMKQAQKPFGWVHMTNGRWEDFFLYEDGVGECEDCEYCVPLYTAPVHASDISQERVDETAKCEREWVGLDDDIPGLGLVTEEFYNGMLCAEDILRKRNT